MALFAKSKRGVDPVGQAERAFAEARVAQGKLAARLSAAQATAAEKRTAAEEAAVTGAADEVLDRAEAEMRAALDREQTLRSALEKLDEQVVHAEQALTDAVDRRDRDLVADHLEELAAELVAAYPRYNDAGAELLRAIAEPQAQIPEAAALARFLNDTRHEVAAACNLLDQELRSRASSIRAGTGSYRVRELIVTKIAPADEAAVPTAQDPTSAG